MRGPVEEGFRGRKSSAHSQGLREDRGLEGDGRVTGAVILQGIFGGQGALKGLGSVGVRG